MKWSERKQSEYSWLFSGYLSATRWRACLSPLSSTTDGAGSPFSVSGDNFRINISSHAAKPLRLEKLCPFQDHRREICGNVRYSIVGPKRAWPERQKGLSTWRSSPPAKSPSHQLLGLEICVEPFFCFVPQIITKALEIVAWNFMICQS